VERHTERDTKIKAITDAAVKEAEAKKSQADKELETKILGWGSGETTNGYASKTLKLPFYTEGLDNMDTYIAQFKLRATSIGIARKNGQAFY
jgi:hypothetical protein